MEPSKNNRSNAYTRRSFMKTAALGAALVSLPSLAQTNPTSNKKKPNLVFVFPDQMRKHALGFLNEDPVITPNLDRFSDNAQFFPNAISNVPVCSPYRSMLMTGRYPISTGVIANLFKTDNHGLPDKPTSFGQALQDAGYKTGYIGKWHLANPEKIPNRTAAAFQEFIDSGQKTFGPGRHGFDDVLYSISVHENQNPKYMENKSKILQAQWSVDFETDKAIDFMDRNQDKPFALFLSWQPPHAPFVIPQKYQDMYRDKKLPRRKNQDQHLDKNQELLYYAGVTWCDDQFGRLLNALEQRGLEDNTIIVFTSDHGEMLGSHGIAIEKTYWYEESIKVPFLIRWPGKIPPGENKMLLSVYDVMPTLLGLMGVRIPQSAEGKDWSKNILTQNLHGAASAFIAHYPYAVDYPAIKYRQGLERHVVFDQGFKRRKNGYKKLHQLGFRGVTDGDYTYVFDKCPVDEPGISFNFPQWDPNMTYEHKGRIRTTEFFYDNVKDPYQLTNIPTDSQPYQEVIQRLRSELKHWLKTVHDPFELNDHT